MPRRDVRQKYRQSGVMLAVGCGIAVALCLLAAVAPGPAKPMRTVSTMTKTGTKKLQIEKDDHAVDILDKINVALAEL